MIDFRHLNASDGSIVQPCHPYRVASLACSEHNVGSKDDSCAAQIGAYKACIKEEAERKRRFRERMAAHKKSQSSGWFS